MRIAGIIGGIGPESTIDYYRQIISVYRERNPDGSYPHLIINNVDLAKLLGLMNAHRLSDVADYLRQEVERLHRAGADFAALAANTPHIVFDDLNRRSPIPLISIVDATRRTASALGLRRVGLFGARFTMEGSFYPGVFRPAGIAIVTPALDEQAYIHEKYFSELVNGIFLLETREGLLAIARRMQAEDGIEALILGGTELPLILRPSDSGGDGLVFLDTTRIHVEAVVERLLS